MDALQGDWIKIKKYRSQHIRYVLFRVAAVQAAPVFMDKQRTIAKACSLIEEASANGADLAVFPECFVPGFPHWFDFMDVEEGMRRFYKRYHENSVLVGSRDTEPLREVAKRTGCHVVIGISERIGASSGTLFNSQVIISDEGAILGVHRKIMPTFYEKILFAMGDGDTLKVFDTNIGKLGSLICGEHTNMLACFAQLAMGEELHAASWPAFFTKRQSKFIDGMDIRVRYYAFAGKVYVVSSCGVVDDGVLDMIAGGNLDRVVSRGGGSMIVGPDGQYVARPVFGDETIVYAEVDTERLAEERAHQDITGHYNRFDIFKLIVDNRPKRPLEFSQ
ncbi:MAG: carbon-nitrogen hydrolase family protein [Aigarchaeota archaeon]|nr:carbon-nitrogen hydrolase family protein [Aigarchaeota archaeon]MDW8092813.1 carbon-nitrogen hydrolase family protein [Nitrososphaerota archaeon]